DQWDIGMLSMDGNHARKLLLAEKHAEAQPQISPDGQWIAYNSNELSGVMMKAEVYIRPFPDVDKGKWQVSTKGGNSSLWSRDGKELFYLSDDNSAMVVSVETKPTFRLGIPKFLFKNSNLGVSAGSGTPWDIHPDGKRFLMIKPAGAAPSTGTGERPKITIVLNWFEELKQRVPVK
ncbi:MAG TPA: hypothetical protein VLL97_14665, partial [Acidobacteriota bacterium]|nr:hypothetical protein [Acidobacteriota bacterium]